MKHRLRQLAALFCTLALLLGLSGPVSAAGDIYFSACNDSVVTLSDSTMPTWSGGVLYAPYSLSSTAATTPASTLTSPSATTAAPVSQPYSTPASSSPSI